MPERATLNWRLALGAIVILACAARAAFPLADPPWASPIGITWHDEGVWAHNARNMALFGAWRMDEWNPMYVSPVFTGLEYMSFTAFGVGLWQARLVSILAGVASVVAIAFGLRAFASRRVALAAALLLAVNYTWVMYSRVALLEGLMVSLLVAAWASYAHADRSRVLAVGAAVFALAAFFTKASAAFFLVALGIDASLRAWDAIAARRRQGLPLARTVLEGPSLALLSLAVGTVLTLAIFVVPNWTEYSFYNLFVYGSRRSAMGIEALTDRASWLPVVHTFFTRQWVLTLAALGGLVPLLVHARRASPGARLLALWFLLGVAELVIHDLGNERRYVFLLPAMAGLAALFVSAPNPFPSALGTWSRRRLALAIPLLLAGAYVALGSLTRQVFMPDIRMSVRTAAAIAVLGTGLAIVAWPRMRQGLCNLTWPRTLLPAAVALMVAFDLAHYVAWARGRTYENVLASRAVGALLPAGTLVQGKLANGLSFENGIRPLFIGPGFGNYADRHERDDVEWILTYSKPELGYEGDVIDEVLDRLPGWRIVATFPVAETSSGEDSAVLIRKAQ